MPSAMSSDLSQNKKALPGNLHFSIYPNKPVYTIPNNDIFPRVYDVTQEKRYW
jgi:hypothetical protein